MNFKNFSLGLALTGLGVMALSTEAQAYQFNFLNVAAAGGGLNNYNFEFVTQGPGDSIAAGQQLILEGFTGVAGLATSPVTDNVSGVLPSNFGFAASGITPTSATFTALANVSLIPGNIRYQTFTVTAADVPTGEVNPSFPGPNNPLAPTPVPEPFTILGSLAALGFGSRFQKEFAKKQAANSEKA